MDTAAALIELRRRLDNIVRVGTVAAIDHATARVRVQTGNLLTGWLPWSTGRAGTTRTWDPPTVGEQVTLLSPSGEPAAAIVLPAIYRDAHPAPSDAESVHLTTYPDGASIQYDHAAHLYRIALPDGASVEIVATGAVHVTGDVIADGISLKTHVHTGILPGGSNTGMPAQ
ncbi:phage baseplate assembly protein V [Immundisolibacter sp.]|uniref:phage baseplate assembly protein V n=1 Tax=Immundisolibacter sp. TaxID=1934948 RepID=UPI002623D86D|nr:phage baseplate assembly protein V [Immundisolibacter sp.]MDD3652315.1 phage baseplate assembly protein V [Immundisolibacter sp.]